MLTVERIEKILRLYRRISVYTFFTRLADDTRSLYLAWFYLTIAVFLSLPYVPIELFLLNPLSKYGNYLRKKAYEARLEKNRKDRGC